MSGSESNVHIVWTLVVCVDSLKRWMPPEGDGVRAVFVLLGGCTAQLVAGGETSWGNLGAKALPTPPSFRERTPSVALGHPGHQVTPRKH